MPFADCTSVVKLALVLCCLIGSTLADAECKYDFKVYVYPLPEDLPAVSIAESARVKKQLNVCQKCIFEQFALEYIVHDFLTQFCGRTMDPEKADFFYLPIIRDAEYRTSLGMGIRDPSSADKALLSIILNDDSTDWVNTFKVPDTYWRRHKGADHILVMPAPVTNFNHESSKRGFYHYMIQLYRPIFMNVEFSSSFVKEYPICAGQKDIVMPYPTTDYEVFNGQIASVTSTVERDRFMFYQGGNHGSCTFIRTQLNNLTQRLEVGMKKARGKYWRELSFAQSVFCPIPVGDSPSSKRMYDVMHLGCIPVVLSDDLVWAFSKETGGVIDPTAFSIQIPQQVIFQSPEEFIQENRRKPLQKLPSGVTIMELAEKVLNKEPCSDAHKIYTPESMHDNTFVNILRCVPAADVAALQQGVKMFSQFYRFYRDNSSLNEIPTALKIMPDGGAIEMMAKLLSVRKQRGIDALSDACETERKAKHAYIGRYPCVKPKPHQRRLNCAQNDDDDRRYNSSLSRFAPEANLETLTQLDVGSIWSFRRCPERCITADIKFFESRRLIATV